MAGIGRRRRSALLALLAGGLLLVPAASASAETIYGGPLPISYANPDVEIAPGESLTFTNLDLTAPHDVTSLAIGSDFRALFRSETVGFGTTVPVVGVESLASGRYSYICSIHSNMGGTITVSGPPGTGRDNKAPALKVKPVSRKAGGAAGSGRIVFRITTDEPATFRIAVSKGKEVVAERAGHLKRGDNKVNAKLTSAGKKLLRESKNVKLKFSASASDSNGNTARRSDKFKLR